MLRFLIKDAPPPGASPAALISRAKAERTRCVEKAEGHVRAIFGLPPAGVVGGPGRPSTETVEKLHAVKVYGGVIGGLFAAHLVDHFPFQDRIRRRGQLDEGPITPQVARGCEGVGCRAPGKAWQVRWIYCPPGLR